MHDTSTFCTLTYSEEHLPKNGTLDPRDTSLFLKRLRMAIKPRKIRYYLVGEYGDQTQRPHYHLAIFGMHLLEEDIIRSVWNKGLTHCGEINEHTAQYIGGYLTKKLTKIGDPKLNGNYPEFARMSRMPGLAAGAIPIAANALRSPQGLHWLSTNPDVPHELLHGKTRYPLGKYLRSKLREQLGKNKGTPKICFENYGLQMRFMLEEDLADKKNKNLSLGAIIINKFAQQRLNEDTRYKINKGRHL